MSFDAIFCINLDHRKDRWEWVMTEFKKLNIQDKVIRFSAIETPDNWQIGCLMSHISIMEISKQKWWEKIFVFEDDAVLVENNIKGNLIILPEKWELIYLGGSFINSDLPYLKKHNNMYSGAWIRSTHAIWYSEIIMNKILKEVWENKRGNIRKFIKKYIAIDLYYSRFLQTYGKTFISSEIYFKQKAGYSDIEKKINNYDKVVFEKFSRIINRKSILVKCIEATRKYIQFYWKFKISLMAFLKSL